MKEGGVEGCGQPGDVSSGSRVDIIESQSDIFVGYTLKEKTKKCVKACESREDYNECVKNARTTSLNWRSSWRQSPSNCRSASRIPLNPLIPCGFAFCRPK
jgi:hypothetical protein